MFSGIFRVQGHVSRGWTRENALQRQKDVKQKSRFAFHISNSFEMYRLTEEGDFPSRVLSSLCISWQFFETPRHVCAASPGHS